MNSRMQELSSQYAGLTDEALLVLAAERHTLVEEALALLQQEFRSRRLALPAVVASPMPDVYGPVKWVTVERFRDLSSAIVARGALEAAAIDCVLRDENTVRMDWQVSNFIGGMRLQVRGEDEQAAREVLHAPPPTMQDGTPSLQPEEHCPFCGSDAVYRVDRTRGLRMVAVWLFGIPLPRGERSWQCDNCGRQCAERDLVLR